jgi:hypothetical protein
MKTLLEIAIERLLQEYPEDSELFHTLLSPQSCLPKSCLPAIFGNLSTSKIKAFFKTLLTEDLIKSFAKRLREVYPGNFEMLTKIDNAERQVINFKFKNYK